MAMEVVTGKRGEVHITSAQIQNLNAGIFGADAVVLNVGEKLAGEIISSNTVRVKSGHLINQGVQSCINTNEYEELTFTSGSSGQSRYDLICAHYTKDSTTGVEDVELVVVNGTPVTSGTPEIPTVTRGNILGGALEDYCPTHKVLIKGANIDSVTLIPTIAGINQVDEKIEDIEKSLDDLAFVRIEGANTFEYDESKIEKKINAYTYSKSQIDTKFSNSAIQAFAMPLYRGVEAELTANDCNSRFYRIGSKMIFFMLSFKKKSFQYPSGGNIGIVKLAEFNPDLLDFLRPLSMDGLIQPLTFHPLVVNMDSDNMNNDIVNCQAWLRTNGDVEVEFYKAFSGTKQLKFLISGYYFVK